MCGYHLKVPWARGPDAARRLPLRDPTGVQAGRCAKKAGAPRKSTNLITRATASRRDDVLTHQRQLVGTDQPTFCELVGHGGWWVWCWRHISHSSDTSYRQARQTWDASQTEYAYLPLPLRGPTGGQAGCCAEMADAPEVPRALHQEPGDQDVWEQHSYRSEIRPHAVTPCMRLRGLRKHGPPGQHGRLDEGVISGAPPTYLRPTNSGRFVQTNQLSGVGWSEEGRQLLRDLHHQQAGGASRVATPIRARSRNSSGRGASGNVGSGSGSGRGSCVVTNQCADSWWVGNHQRELVGLRQRPRPGCAGRQMEAPEDGGTPR